MKGNENGTTKGGGGLWGGGGVLSRGFSCQIRSSGSVVELRSFPYRRGPPGTIKTHQKEGEEEFINKAKIVNYIVTLFVFSSHFRRFSFALVTKVCVSYCVLEISLLSEGHAHWL